MPGFVTVVSGLPRSGTSLMMRMLEAGGLSALTDGERTADVDNPKGYFELERVKQTSADASWLNGAEGKVVKVISQLLKDLPADRSYRVIFMRRSLDEVLASQRKMLTHRQEEDAAADEDMKGLFVDHLAEVEAWLKQAPHMEVTYVNYGRIVAEARTQAERINGFLGGILNVDQMVGAVDPSLYRNRA